MSPKLRNWKKFVLMFEPALKCQDNAIFKLNYSLKLFIKIAYSCCFSLGGNQDFPDFLQKSFITLTVGTFLPPNYFHFVEGYQALTLKIFHLILFNRLFLNRLIVQKWAITGLFFFIFGFSTNSKYYIIVQ